MSETAILAYAARRMARLPALADGGAADLAAARTGAGTYVLDAYARLGLPLPTHSQLGDMITRAVERMSPDDRRTGTVPATVVAFIHGEVARATGSEARAVNITSAEAARLEHAGALPRLAGPAAALLLAGVVHGLAATAGAPARSLAAFADDPRSITPASFAASPFRAAGLDWPTFAYVRASVPDAAARNIIHGAEDARTNGFAPTNRRVTTAFTVLDTDDGGRRAERNRLLAAYRERLRNDAEIARLKSLRERAGSDEERRAIDAQLGARGARISADVGLRPHIDSVPTERGRAAGRVVEEETFKAITGVHLDQGRRLSDDPLATANLTRDELDRTRAAVGIDQRLNVAADQASNRRVQTTVTRIATEADNVLGVAMPPGPAPSSPRAESTPTPSTAPRTPAATAPPAKPTAPT